MAGDTRMTEKIQARGTIGMLMPVGDDSDFLTRRAAAISTLRDAHPHRQDPLSGDYDFSHQEIHAQMIRTQKEG